MKSREEGCRKGNRGGGCAQQAQHLQGEGGLRAAVDVGT